MFDLFLPSVRFLPSRSNFYSTVVYCGSLDCQCYFPSIFHLAWAAQGVATLTSSFIFKSAHVFKLDNEDTSVLLTVTGQSFLCMSLTLKFQNK